MALPKVPSNLDSITATTQSASDNSTNVATTAYVTTAVSNIVDGAPSTLNTLNEIAAALNDDAALNTTLTTSIATKLPLAGGTMTGDLTISSTYPKISLVDTDNNPDFSIIGGSGQFGIYDETNTAYRLQINSSGNSTFGGHITASGTNNIYVGDNGKFTAGGGDDLQIYHDGTNSHIYNNTGYTTLRTAAVGGYLYLHGDNVHLRGQTANETLLTAVLNGAVTLYHDNTAKLETTTNGISAKGTSSNLITTSSTANDRAGAGFTATESSTDSTRRATMYLDADNGAFSTGDSGAYFYMEKVGGGGQVNFINQDTAGYNFRTGGSHVRMNIGSTGKTSWSAGGIGTVATQNRDFTFYTEGGSNGIDIRSNDYRNILLGSGGSSGAAMDAGYIGIYKNGSTEIALNANGNTYFNGGNVGIGTASPGNKLTVNGSVESLFDDNNEGGQLILRAKSGITDPKRYSLDSDSIGQFRIIVEDDADSGNGHGGNGFVSCLINKSGIFTNSVKPYFLARRNGNITNYNCASTTTTQTLFNYIETGSSSSTGQSAFNTTTGQFTAPVAGLYLFHIGAYSNITIEQAWLTSSNGARIAWTDMVSMSQSGYASQVFSGSMQFPMTAGEAIRVHFYSAGDSSATIYDNNYHTYWRGVLIG